MGVKREGGGGMGEKREGGGGGGEERGKQNTTKVEDVLHLVSQTLI